MSFRNSARVRSGGGVVRSSETAPPQLKDRSQPRSCSSSPRYLHGQHIYWQACISAQLGEQEAAVDLLREAFSEGLEYGIEFHRDVNLEVLRDYAPFQELMRPK